MFASRPRPFAMLAGVALLASLTTGCGAQPDPEESHPSSRSITDAAGSRVEVPARPKRVVALSEPTLEGLVALGIEPVGVASARGQDQVSPYLRDRVGDATIVASTTGPDLDRVAVVRPDLIVVDYTVASRDSIGALNKIAPTAMVSDRGADWRSAFERLGIIVNQTEQTRKVIAAHDHHVRAVKAKVADYAGQRASIVRWDGRGPRAVGSGGHADEVVRGLGLTRPAAQRAKVSNRTPVVSLEALDRIDGDWMFFGTLGDAAEGRRQLAEAERLRPFTRLKAVRNDHVRVIDGTAWSSSGGPIAVELILDELEKALAK